MWQSLRYLIIEKVSSQYPLRFKNYVYKSVGEFFLAHCGGHTAARHRFQTKRDHALSRSDSDFSNLSTFSTFLSFTFTATDFFPPLSRGFSPRKRWISIVGFAKNSICELTPLVEKVIYPLNFTLYHVIYISLYQLLRFRRRKILNGARWKKFHEMRSNSILSWISS